MKQSVTRILSLLAVVFLLSLQFTIPVLAEEEMEGYSQSRSSSFGNKAYAVHNETGQEELLGSFLIDYSVSGGRDFRSNEPEDANQSNSGSRVVYVTAKRGETISLSYTIHFPDRVYANTRVSVFIDPKYYRQNMSKLDDYDWETFYSIESPGKERERYDASGLGDTKSGTIEFTVPKDYDSQSFSMEVNAYFAYTYKKAANPDRDRKLEKLTFSLHGTVDDTNEEEVEGGSFVLTPYSINDALIGEKEETYTDISDIYDDVTLNIEKDGSFTLEMPEGRGGLIPKWENYGDSSPQAYRPSIPAFTAAGKLQLSGLKYKGGLAYYDKESEYYSGYKAGNVTVDNGEWQLPSRTLFGVSDTFSPVEGTLTTEHHYGWTKDEPEYFEVTLELEGNFKAGNTDEYQPGWKTLKIVFRTDG